MLNKNIIDIVSIATSCSIHDVELVKKELKSQQINFNFFNEENVVLNYEPNDHFAHSNAYQRFLNFKLSIENPHSNILWCIRGGYGSAEILPFLYEMPKPKYIKTLIGFSDIATISSFVIEKWNWRVICAPMLKQIISNKVSQNSINNIFNIINHKNSEIKYKIKLLNNCKNPDFSAKIVGGCLSVLASNFGTKNQINWQDKILFLEDEGEDGERLDRYLTQIFYMISENNFKPKAILLGNFNMSNEFGVTNANKIAMAISRFSDKIIDLPIYQEITDSLGHSFEQLPLFLGLETLIVNGESLIQNINKN
jgi:muramoyltetrapeptide carboxypeptidase